MIDSYQSRGVSATKEDVHAAVAAQSRGLFPGAFCKIVPDPAGQSDWCAAFHADGAGTKSSAAYLMYRESGDTRWFAGIAQDALVMNTDDLLCVGAAGGFYVSSTIGRNAQRFDAACLKALIGGTEAMIDRLIAWGIDITLTGGETADVGDLVRTVICDSTVFVRLRRSRVIDASRIKPGRVIIGLASFGQMSGEEQENSGIGSNGLTAARHLLLQDYYRRRYPESFADTLQPELAYSGHWRLEDTLPGSSLSVGEAILSPTRTYLPVLRELLDRPDIQIEGMIHCTGGGQTKCRDFGRGIRYVKDNLFPAPPIFAAIRETGGISAEEMYQVFNMGHRLELIVSEPAVAPILDTCARFKLSARVIGYTEACDGPGNEVIIRDQGQTHVYRSRI
jgi:phosphoribosylformylglycinamidine cyclo-ligase